MTTVVKGLVNNAAFKITDAEIIMSMLSTWGNKFNMIILSVSTGIVVSLIPNLTQALVNKDKKDINRKISQSLNVLLFFTVPMTVGISFLAKPIWTLFYGNSIYGSSVLSFLIFSGLMICLFTVVISIMQVLKDYKTVFWSLFLGVILKFILNNSLISVFYKIGVPAYYGVISATIIGYLLSFIICIFILCFKYDISFEDVIKSTVDIISSTMIMIFTLLLIKFIIPISSSIRINNLFIILAYTLIGGVIYMFYAHRCGLIKKLFGNKFKLYKKNNE